MTIPLFFFIHAVLIRNFQAINTVKKNELKITAKTDMLYGIMRNTLVILMFALMAGCAAAQKETAVTVFYPDPPVPPRLQFLTSLTGEKDLQPEKSAFEAFVTGSKESERRLDKPYGIAVRGGKIYVCDTNQTVMVFDLEKKTFDELQGAQGLGKLAQPLNISIDAEGSKFVTDPMRGQVVVFDKNDFYVTALGFPGNWKPVDAVPYDDKLYVADIKNGEIVVFDKKSGDVLDRFGQKGDPAGRLILPTNIAFDKEGYLYVSDAGRFQLLKLDRDGHLRATFGELGTNPSNFARPKGLALDREGRLYAVDAAFDNVQIFSKSRALLLFFGKAGRGPGDFFLPAKIFIDYDDLKYFQPYADPNFELEYLVFVTNQFGNRMVNVYGFGKERGKKYPSDEELLEQLKERLKKLKPQEPSEKAPGTDAEKK